MDAVKTPGSQDGAPVCVESTDPAVHQDHGDMSHIPGWGSDLERANRPAVPMERTPPRLDVPWSQPQQQPHRHVQVFHSTERSGLTPVFGSTVPPSGLSGRMREFAFRYSENDLRHWLILLMADRVNVSEGLLSDLAHGHVPNILGEMGIRAEWRHNRAGLVRKVLVASAAIGTAVYLMRRRHR